jgi:hypothetical protein
MNEYTKEDYTILLTILKDAYRSTVRLTNQPNLITYLNKIILTGFQAQSGYLNASTTRLIYRAPLNRMPTLINAQKTTTKLIASWRLQIGK